MTRQEAIKEFHKILAALKRGESVPSVHARTGVPKGTLYIWRNVVQTGGSINVNICRLIQNLTSHKKPRPSVSVEKGTKKSTQVISSIKAEVSRHRASMEKLLKGL